MHLNTQRHRRIECPLTVHKIQLSPVFITAEAGNSSLGIKNSPDSLFTLNRLNVL